MEQDERELPTIREIESQIWKIARRSNAESTQLDGLPLTCSNGLRREKQKHVKTNKSCRRRFGRSNCKSGRLPLGLTREYLRNWRLAAYLIERIEAREGKGELLNQGRGYVRICQRRQFFEADRRSRRTLASKKAIPCYGFLGVVVLIVGRTSAD